MIVLELCACEGGATAGYISAGATVYAVDMNHNRLAYNPATHKRVTDMFTVLNELTCHGMTRINGVILSADAIDFIHVSPPCQYYTRGNAGKVTAWPRLIPEVRTRLEALNIPYVIENVADAAWDMWNPVELCGCMFNLTAIDDDGEVLHLHRKRLFESSFSIAPKVHNHEGQEWVAGVYGGARRDKYEAKYIRKGGYVPPNKEVAAALLGIEHRTTWRGLTESIPPAYARYVAEQYLRSVE